MASNDMTRVCFFSFLCRC